MYAFYFYLSVPIRLVNQTCTLYDLCDSTVGLLCTGISGVCNCNYGYFYNGSYCGKWPVF